MLTDGLGELLDGRGGEHIVDGDLALGPLGQPCRELLGDITLELRQRVEDALGRLARHHRPRGEGQPFRGVARRHVDPARLLLRLGCLGRGLRFGVGEDLLGLTHRGGVLELGKLDLLRCLWELVSVRSGGALGGLLLGELRNLLAVLHGVPQVLRDVAQARVLDRRQLQLRDVELVLDAVLDADRHERVEAQLDERDLGR